MPLCTAMLGRLFNDHKYMDISRSLYIRNIAILENKKSVCIFLHQLVNTCDLHLLKGAICSTIPVKMLPIGQFEKFFLKFIKFQSEILKIYLCSSIPVANS